MKWLLEIIKNTMMKCMEINRVLNNKVLNFYKIMKQNKKERSVWHLLRCHTRKL